MIKAIIKIVFWIAIGALTHQAFPHDCVAVFAALFALAVLADKFSDPRV